MKTMTKVLCGIFLACTLTACPTGSEKGKPEAAASKPDTTENGKKDEGHGKPEKEESVEETEE